MSRYQLSVISDPLLVISYQFPEHVASYSWELESPAYRSTLRPQQAAKGEVERGGSYWEIDSLSSQWPVISHQLLGGRRPPCQCQVMVGNTKMVLHPFRVHCLLFTVHYSLFTVLRAINGMPSQDRAAILLLSGTLALTNVACSRVNSSSSSNEPTHPVAASSTPSTATNPRVGQVSSPVVNPSPPATPISQPTIAPQEAYERALDAAYSATTIAQSAQSSGDWQLVSDRWREAIGLLKRVPSSSTYHVIAQPKIAQYERSLRIAQQKAKRPPTDAAAKTEIAVSPRTVFQPSQPSSNQTPSLKAPATALTPATESKTNTDKQRVFKAPIKRRKSGTPVIDVIFNGTQTFEMVLDTGASGTVITQAMANNLGIVSEGEVKANTASAKGVTFHIGKVESIVIDGAVAQNVQVAIGGADLEIGLLGQDFFSKYDVSIKQDVVEFHAR